MSAVQSRPSQSTKIPPASITAFGRHKTSLLERANPGIRRSTPDSEALASSDDEADHSRPPLSLANTCQLNKPARRTSWLNEVPPAAARRASTHQGGAYSPNTSLPTTPAADLSSWHPPTTSSCTNGTVPWGTTAVPAFPWSSTGIWNESRTDPAARFQQVLAPPTNTTSLSAASLTHDFQPPLKNKGLVKETAIPFSIPLHPTPKTYRSQSYSVGQLDTEATSPVSVRSSANAGRNTVGSQASALPHRPSRPSVLGDLGHDSGTLGRVREVDDDEEEEEGSEASHPHSVAQAKKIEFLTRENAMLRQAASGSFERPLRGRAGSAISASSGLSNPAATLGQHGMHANGPESGDLAIDDHDDGLPSFNSELRDPFGRPGVQNLNAFDRQQNSVGQSENRNMDSAKRAQWQTSLGFGSVPDIPQSRRHSFADVPTRQGSIGSAGKGSLRPTPNVAPTESADRDEGYGTYSDDTQEALREHRESTQFALRTLEEQNIGGDHLRLRQSVASYFSGPETNHPQQGGSGPTLHQAYVSPNTYGRSRHLNTQTQPLYIVTFKCCRADVFYIQEGTGLQVKPGELVIVEADRGTDLGTVAHSNVAWEDARQLKEQYAEEHYKWLMLFSRQSQTGGPNATNPNGVSAGGGPGSAVGGMGPAGAHGPQDLQAGGELKPKMIRRLAQNHEIQTLREKEGNEARAKRVCQSKVAEHRLNMEILDAEFQMDWKKLTFYYFADAYINFNSLVTDLFKVYKTRIWMSAINPASFVTPTSSLNVPPPFAPIGVEPGERITSTGHRHLQGLSFAQSSDALYGDAPEHPHSLNAISGNTFRHPYFNHHRQHNPGSTVQPQGHDLRALSNANVGPHGTGATFAAYPGHYYPMLDPSAPSFSAASEHPTSRSNPGEQLPAPDWTARFQDLTLGRT